MRAFLERLPLPAGCVSLGMIGLGMLLRPYGKAFLCLFGLAALILLLLVWAKLCIPEEREKAFHDLVMLGLVAGSAMSCMMLSAQAKAEFGIGWAVFPWYFGVLLHLFVIGVFSIKLVKEHPAAKTVRGAWLLVYVGIAAAAITAPAFSAELIGRILLVPAAAGAVILLPLVYKAQRLNPEMPEGQQPLFCISAAPVSIWLAGYLRSSISASKTEALILALFALVFYIPALLHCLKYIKGRFYPSFAAFTFPFVINASALKQTSALLEPSGFTAVLFNVLITAETVIAALLCVYVLYRYIKLMCSR